METYSDAKECYLEKEKKERKAAGPALNGLFRCVAVAIAVHSALFLNCRVTGASLCKLCCSVNGPKLQTLLSVCGTCMGKCPSVFGRVRAFQRELHKSLEEEAAPHDTKRASGKTNQPVQFPAFTMVAPKSSEWRFGAYAHPQLCSM